jgi:hypothetical protein
MEVEKGGGIPMTLTTIVGGSVPIRTDVRGGSPALFAMPVGVHTTGPVAPAPVTRKSSEDDQMRHAWWYAIIAMTAALLALVGMAVFQYAQTLDTAVTTTAVSAIPAEYAGVSIPQAMRLSDTVVSAVPAQFAGVSNPQAMRLSDGS